MYMKNVKEYLAELIGGETPAFVRVFEALPSDKLDWKPDPKSRSAIELASAMAEETHQLATILETGELNFDPTAQKIFGSTTEVVNTFKEGAEKLKNHIDSMTEENWDAEARMLMGGQEMWKSTRGGMAWGFFLDLIHHRGQLATYIRPMGGKVPSIYGPSADSNG